MCRCRSPHSPTGCSLALGRCCGIWFWGAAPSPARAFALDPFRCGGDTWAAKSAAGKCLRRFTLPHPSPQRNEVKGIALDHVLFSVYKMHCASRRNALRRRRYYDCMTLTLLPCLWRVCTLPGSNPNCGIDRGRFCSLTRHGSKGIARLATATYRVCAKAYV